MKISFGTKYVIGSVLLMALALHFFILPLFIALDVLEPFSAWPLEERHAILLAQSLRPGDVVVSEGELGHGATRLGAGRVKAAFVHQEWLRGRSAGELLELGRQIMLVIRVDGQCYRYREYAQWAAGGNQPWHPYPQPWP